MTSNHEEPPSRTAGLLRLAEQRWAAIGQARPDLTPAVDLQRQLVTRSLDLAAAIEHVLPVQTVLAPAEIAVRLGSKRPAFSGVPFEVDGGQLAETVIAFCDDLAKGGAGPPADRVRQTLARGEINIGSLISASLMRQLHAVRTTANHIGVAPDLLWLVAELGAAPLANRLQRTYVADAAVAHAELRAKLDAWDEGRCPACGSWPAFAERLGDRRQLRCSFCGTAWQPARYCCIYCDEHGDGFLTAAADDQTDAGRRLELCRLCGGYLKSLALDHPTPFELMAVEDLASSDLDAGAADRGYSRPPMREIEAV